MLEFPMHLQYSQFLCRSLGYKQLLQFDMN